MQRHPTGSEARGQADLWDTWGWPSRPGGSRFGGGRDGSQRGQPGHRPGQETRKRKDRLCAELDTATAIGQRLGSLVGRGSARRLGTSSILGRSEEQGEEWLDEWVSSQDGRVAVRVTPGGLDIVGGKLQGSGSGGGQRGPIRGFSRKSQRRLMGLLMRTPLQDWLTGKGSDTGQAAFLSLTWHDWWPDSAEALALQQRQFVRRLERAWPGVEWLWKLESQRRGAPHYHYLVLLSERVCKADFRRWVRDNWHEVACPYSADHLQHGTDTVFLYGTPGKLLHYLRKYVGKVQENEGHLWGRRWGRSDGWPTVDCDIWVLERAAAEELARRLRRWGRRSGYLRGWLWWKSGHIYGASGELLRGLDRKRAPPSE